MNQVYSNRALATQIDELLVYCRYGVHLDDAGQFVMQNPSGCPARIKYCERVRHEAECPYRPKGVVSSRASSPPPDGEVNPPESQPSEQPGSSVARMSNIQRLVEVLSFVLRVISRVPIFFCLSLSSYVSVPVATLRRAYEALPHRYSILGPERQQSR